MDIDLVNPEFQKTVRSTPHVNINNHLARLVSRFAIRRLLHHTPRPDVTIRDISEGSARLRLYTPQHRAEGALIWIHGGGMVIGAPQQDDTFCSEIAATLGITIASVDYALAPEHPFPIPQQDCLAVWRWLQRNAEELGVDNQQVVVGGGSAGGGLAASLTNTLHDAGGVQPIGQLLLYPMLDDRTAARTDLDTIDHFVWNNKANRAGWSALLTGLTSPGSETVPAAAAPARRRDLTGLPPTWISVGDIDLFHEEDADYADRLTAADVSVECEIIPGAPHGFITLAADAAITRRTIEKIHTWLGTLYRTP